MNEEIKYIRVRSVNSTMKLLYGDKLTWTEKLIRLRSNLVHMEWQFSDRYGSISFSATKADGCNCCRFKMIGYSHAYRWSTILIPVTAEQEARIFAKACEMADVEHLEVAMGLGGDFKPGVIFFGPDAIKYDTAGVSLSFISKRRFWNPSNKRNWCNESVGIALMVEWPDLFILRGPNIDSIDWPLAIPPHEQLPDQTHFMIQHYFENGVDLTRPNQQDIDNIIAELQ